MKRIKQNKQSGNLDKKLLFVTLLLTVAGLVFLVDASAPLAEKNFSDKYFFFKQQLIWAIIGVVSLFVAMKIHYKLWEKVALYLFLASIAGLILVFIPGIGVKFLGARRWIVISFISFQPSEFIKLSLAVYLAKLSSKGKKFKAFVAPLAISVFLIMLQPDLGTTVVISAIAMAQIFVSGISFMQITVSLLFAMLTGILLIITSDYRRDRLLTFFQSTQSPLDKSYHIRQILLAIGSGGLFGVGLGHSRQKYLFLPETATDSIFAVISEEIGFIGSTILIFIYLFFIIRGLKISKNAPDMFSKVLSLGIVVWIGGQAFLNLASMTALVPLTGIPLPFISYGGSSLTTILVATGILLNISKHEQKNK